MEIQDVSAYAVWGHCFSFQSFSPLASSHFYSCFTKTPSLISSEGQVRAAHPLWVFEFICCGALWKHEIKYWYSLLIFPGTQHTPTNMFSDPNYPIWISRACCIPGGMEAAQTCPPLLPVYEINPWSNILKITTLVKEQQMDKHNLESLWNSTGILSSVSFVVVAVDLWNRARLKSIVSLEKLKIVMSFVVSSDHISFP